jgi:hypothetical protein
MEEKAAALDGQMVHLKVVRAGITDQHVNGRLHYLHPNLRPAARRPLRLEVDGFDPVYLTVGKAERANRTRLTLNLNPTPSFPSALHVTQTFVPASHPLPLDTPTTHFSDSYDLHSASGFRALYRDAHGTTAGCPSKGTPLEWAPDLQWLLQPEPVTLQDPLTAFQMQLLFDSIDIQSCFRIADPVAQSPSLATAVQQRYQRTLLSPGRSAHPHPANWLTPSYYKHLAAKGPVDWVFLYPPLALADLALAIALSRARVGAALWVPRAFLSNMPSTRLTLLTTLKRERRLAIVQSWDNDSLWVCCFTTSTHRTRMMCPSSAAITAWTSI